MNMKEFYEDVEKIFLFPGCIDDLNSRTGKNIEYERIRMKGGKQFLTGIVIPSIEEIKELTAVAQEGVDAAQGLLGQLGVPFEDDDVLKQGFAQAQKMLEKVAEKAYGNPALMQRDIRMKAKELGAYGVAYFQMYNKDGLYMGVPVRNRNAGMR